MHERKKSRCNESFVRKCGPKEVVRRLYIESETMGYFMLYVLSCACCLPHVLIFWQSTSSISVICDHAN